MKRKLLMLVTVGAALAAFSGCTLYSDQNGTAIFNATRQPAISFTLSKSQSQTLWSFWSNNCHASWSCVSATLVGGNIITDPLGRDAVADCGLNALAQVNPQCPFGDADVAMNNRLLDQPGGWPYSTDWQNRCVGWGLRPVSLSTLITALGGYISGDVFNAPPLFSESDVAFAQPILDGVGPVFDSWYYARPGHLGC